MKNQNKSLKQSNNIDEEKIKRIKERRERRKRKNQTSEKEPSYNTSEKDNMNSPEIQKNNNNSILSDKKLNISNNNNNNINKIISDSNSEYSINNNNIENITSLSNQNYRFLSKNYNEIKLENVKEFLNKTNAEKPSYEQKEYEIKNMIKVMELKPKEFDIKTNKEEESIFTANNVIVSNSQYIIGSIVNTALVVSALNLKGRIKNFGVITMPSIATILGGYVFGTSSTLLVWMIPAIWIGNFAYIYAFKKIKVCMKKNYFLAGIVGIAVKVVVIFGVFSLLNLYGIFPPKMVENLQMAMGLTQLVTATIGTLIGFAIYKIETRAIQK